VTCHAQGSVFVELKEEAEASRAVEAALEVGGEKLLVEMKEAYLLRKKAVRSRPFRRLPPARS